MTTLDLWPIPLGGGAWGAGINMWHPETPASYESLPAPLATQIPTLWIHTFGGRGHGGALILDRCRAFNLFASVDAHLCSQAKKEELELERSQEKGEEVLQGRYLKDRTICLGTVRELEARICSLGRTRDSLQKSIRYFSRFNGATGLQCIWIKNGIRFRLVFTVLQVYSVLASKTEFVSVGVTPQWKRTH